MEPPALTLEDHIAGKAKDLAKVVVPTPFGGVMLADGGAEYPMGPDKRIKPRKKLAANLATLGADFVVMDLGMLDNHHSIEYFLDANSPLMVIEPSAGALSAGRIFHSLAIRRAHRSFSRTAKVKKALKRIEDNGLPEGKGVFGALKEALSGDKKLLAKLDKVMVAPLTHIMLSKARYYGDLDFGPSLRTSLEESTGLTVSYLGFVPDHGALRPTSTPLPPLVYSQPDSNAQAAFTSAAATLAGTPDDELTREALKKAREEISDDSARWLDSIREEIEELKGEKRKEFEASIEREREQMLARVEGEIQSQRREKELSVQAKLKAWFEREKGKVEAEIEAYRKSAWERADAQAREFESASLKRAEDSVRNIEQSRTERMETELSNAREAQARLLATEAEAERRRRFSELEQLSAENRERLRTRLIDERDASMAKFEQELLEAQELRRHEIRAAAVGEVEKIREMVWNDLEADRRKKTEEVEAEVEKFRQGKMDEVYVEMEEYRSRKKVDTVQETDALRGSLIQGAWRDVMLFSSAFDEESDRSMKRLAEAQRARAQLERDAILEKAVHDAEELYNSRLLELTKKLAGEEKAGMEAIAGRVATQEARALAASAEKLRIEGAKKRDLVKNALVAFKDRAKARIESEHNKLAIQVEQEILELRRGNMESAKVEAANHYAKLKAVMERKIEEERNNLRTALDAEIEKRRSERMDVLARSLEIEEAEHRQKLDMDITLSRKHMTEALSGEMEQLRHTWFEKLKAEVDALKADMLNAMAKEVANERADRLRRMDLAVRNEEKLLRNKFIERITEEERQARAALREQVEAERKALRAQMKSTLTPRLAKLEQEVAAQLEDKRIAGLAKLK
ncbi:MAG: hypothetical protein OEZ04_12245, partial [Nitrospinota bacterium]|nr:hypothetical protein [Nitrospinota bacterium]